MGLVVWEGILVGGYEMICLTIIRAAAAMLPCHDAPPTCDALTEAGCAGVDERTRHVVRRCRRDGLPDSSDPRPRRPGGGRQGYVLA
jgi:hypothetical protein